ncbi:MAG: hypothetical protein OIN85_06445, partial [Candidatus Methanoperedens sp.]|nr:hypothetical protein [Candidatus Methanoperedens sp.]
MTINVTEKIRKMMGWCPMMSMKNTVLDSGVEYAFVSGTKGGGMSASKTTIYEEKAPYSATIKLVMVSGLLALGILFFIATFAKAPEQAEIVLLLTVSITALVTWSFFSIKFRITNNGVEAVMP